MIYSDSVLDENIEMEEELQLCAKVNLECVNTLNDVQQGVMKHVEKMDDVLSLLNNHFLLESMIMSSMASL
jgi:hypothetical protein